MQTPKPVTNEHTITVPLPLIEATLQYFWTRPMGEVYELFNHWQVALQTGTPQGTQIQPPTPAMPEGKKEPTGQPMHRDELTAQAQA